MANNPEDEDNVAVYIDRPNVRNTECQYKNKALLEGIEKEYGKIVKCNSYLEFGSRHGKFSRTDMDEKSYEMYKYNINFISIPTINGKNPTDLHIGIDMVEDVYQNEHIDTFVIVTSDKDFIPVVKKLIEKGKNVVVVLPHDSKYFNNFSTNAGANVHDLGVMIRKYTKTN